MNAKSRMKKKLANTTLLASARTGHAWLTMAAPSAVEGIPHQLYRKSIMKVGRFVKDAEGLEFEVTADTLSNWAAQFHRMRDNGVEVPMPNTHAGDGNPDQNRGYVRDMFVDEDELVMVCELIGQDAITAAARSDVSISSPPKLVDGESHEYIRPIVHVALCTDPVVPGLGEFVPIAASRKASASKEKVMNWKDVKEALGTEKELTDDNASEIICSYLKVLGQKVADLEASSKKVADPVPKKEKEEEKDEAKTLAASRASDPLVVGMVGDGRRLKLERLVERGKLTPAQSKKLTERYTSTEAVKLELQSGGDGSEFDTILEVLDMRDPVQLGEKTGSQTLELQRGDDGTDGTGDMLVKDAERRTRESEELMAMSR